MHLLKYKTGSYAMFSKQLTIDAVTAASTAWKEGRFKSILHSRFRM
jgi:hypothetical protein